MTTRDTIEEISAIVGRTTNLLIADIGIAGQQGADLRFAVGDLNANIAVYLADGTFANRLLQCFRLATAAGITILQLDAVLEQLTTEQPISLEASIVVENSITFALAQDGKIIGATTYTSRDDVDAAMKHMKGWFDIARDLVQVVTIQHGHEPPPGSTPVAPSSVRAARTRTPSHRA